MFASLSFFKKIVFVAATALLAVSLPAGLYLVQQSQEIYQRAQTPPYPSPDCGARAIGNNVSAQNKSVANNNSASDVLGDTAPGCGECNYNGAGGCIPVCYPDATCEMLICDLCKNVAVCHPPPPSSPGPSPTPRIQCNDTCVDTTTCLAEDVCYFAPGETTGKCRNASCVSEASCLCSSPSPTPICNSTCQNNTQCLPEHVCYINPGPTPTPAPTPSPVPLCDSVCQNDTQCSQGTNCYFAPGETTGKCRNLTCATETSCVCATPSPSPTPEGYCRNSQCLTETSCVCAVPTPSPGNAVCTEIKAYSVTVISDPATWQQLTASQLSTLKAGDLVYITVRGSVTNTVIDKGRIRVNSSVWTVENETSNLKPGSSDEFYISYTMPTGINSFTFEGEVHNQTTNTWH